MLKQFKALNAAFLTALSDGLPPEATESLLAVADASMGVIRAMLDATTDSEILVEAPRDLLVAIATQQVAMMLASEESALARMRQRNPFHAKVLGDAQAEKLRAASEEVLLVVFRNARRLDVERLIDEVAYPTQQAVN